MTIRVATCSEDKGGRIARANTLDGINSAWSIKEKGVSTYTE